MEERKAKIIFTKNGQGKMTCRITLPNRWINEIGYTKEKRNCKISLNNNKILIERSENNE